MGNFFTDNDSLRFHLHNDLMKEIIRLKERDYADKDKYDFAPENYEDAIDSYERVLGIVGEITADVLAQNAEGKYKYVNLRKRENSIFVRTIQNLAIIYLGINQNQEKSGSQNNRKQKRLQKQHRHQKQKNN